MFELVRRLSRFLATMDAKLATSLALSLAILVSVAAMLIYGRGFVSVDADGGLSRLFEQVAASPLAVIGVIAIFSLLALTGFPQFMLIAATVVWFGPWNGALYAWIATMASASVTFAIGRLFGGEWVVRIGGKRGESLIGFLNRHGVVASGLIRVVPSAPFIVVNAAAGAAHIPFWKYLLGSGVGIVPKISLVAALGAIAPDQAANADGLSSVLSFFTEQEPRRLAILFALVVGWLFFLYAVRVIYQRLRTD
ncbi:MAG: TVP38/TMEM64 family protein [Alphaproteobacteria bacterium]|nr:TVP38/TMEM64 family protein [Alphaproteobacteria bacterium]